MVHLPRISLPNKCKPSNQQTNTENAENMPASRLLAQQTTLKVHFKVRPETATLSIIQKNWS
jgi:hypothetical protein